MSSPPPSRVHLLAKPTIAGRDTSALVERCRTSLDRAGIDSVVLRAESAEEMELEARRVVDAGAERLVVLGGDGMVHIAVQAVAQRDVVLGLVPVGTGNDFAGGLELPTELDDALTAAVGPPTPVDLLRIGDRWAASVATLGFSVAVNARANRMRRPRGSSRYTVATLLELPRLRSHTYELMIDGEQHLCPAVVVTIANTSDFGGGMRISPDARANDGLLDVTVVGETGRLELLWWFRKVFDGSHLDHPKVSAHRGARVEITSAGAELWADGEPIGTSPLVVEVVPGALRLAGLADSPDR